MISLRYSIPFIIQISASSSHTRARRTSCPIVWVSYHIRVGNFPKNNVMLDQLQMHLRKDISRSPEEKQAGNETWIPLQS